MKARTAAIILIGVTALCIAAVMGIRIARSGKADVIIDTNRFATRGIDVSAHNGDIDFNSVADDGINFVYIKATEGATWRDARFEDNYAAATNAGLKVGAYHFFRFDVEGWLQSVNLLRAIGHRPLDLPIAVDVEEWGNPTGYSTEQIINDLRSFIELVRQAGREVIIYTNKNGYHRFVRGHFDDVNLWICSFTNPAMVESHRWTFWQHSHHGRIKGIQGEVDLCTFNTPHLGEYADWIAQRPSVARINH